MTLHANSSSTFVKRASPEAVNSSPVNRTIEVNKQPEGAWT
jgi:hypothetical protein